MLLSHEAVADFPFNDVLVDLTPGADSDAVLAEIEATLPSALVLSQETHGPTISARNYTSMFQQPVLPVSGAGVRRGRRWS